MVGVELSCPRFLHPPTRWPPVPDAKGHLTDSHRCPRRAVFVAAEVLVAALAGGAARLLLVIMFDPTGRQITDVESAISVVVGACLAVGINRALRS
jgi:hypothetical protein